MSDPAGLDLDFLDESKNARRRTERRRTAATLGVSLFITLVWVFFVTANSLWDRVTEFWAASVTMVFGSFVAGSTPQGGGAVAFPVFTKGLGIGPEVARSFSLFIQTVGMGAATAAILIKRVRVEWRAVAVGLPVAASAFLVTVYAVGDSSDPFLKAEIPSEYVKVSFTLVVAAMAFITYLASRVRISEVHREIPRLNWRTYGALMFVAAVGGIASALTGSGADVFLYLFLGVLLGVEVKVGVPTSVIVMAGVSVVALLVLGLGEGQLSVQVVGDRVTRVGSMAVDLDAATHDVFGLWIAAVPVVAWGAPMGAWVASKVSSRQLVTFVLLLAASEVITTAFFVPELRTDTWLLIYAIGGGAILGGGLWLVARGRRAFFDQPELAVGATYARRDLSVSRGYKEALAAGREDPGESATKGDEQ